MTAVASGLVRAASLADLRAAGRLVVHVDRETICLFADGDEVHAVDNRCPHMVCLRPSEMRRLTESTSSTCTSTSCEVETILPGCMRGWRPRYCSSRLR